MKNYREKNIEHFREYDREYKREHKSEKIKKYYQEYRKRNIERIRAKEKKYDEEHREQRREYYRKRRAYKQAYRLGLTNIKDPTIKIIYVHIILDFK